MHSLITSKHEFDFSRKVDDVQEMQKSNAGKTPTGVKFMKYFLDKFSYCVIESSLLIPNFQRRWFEENFRR